MTFSHRCLFLVVIHVLVVPLETNGASDSEIDRLLKQLPPPEKLVKINSHEIRANDPALRDPLVKQIGAASDAKQWKRTLELSRQLAARYPSSAAANYYAGYFASNQKRYSEAATAFRRSIALQPEFVLPHFSLAVVEWEQRHFDGALKQLRIVTKLEPTIPAGWVALSLCAEMVGAKQESVIAARHLVALAPQQVAAWVRLALAESNVGNTAAATQAMNRAIQLQQRQKGSKASPSSKKATSKKKQ